MKYNVKHISPEVKKIEKKVGPKILANPYYGCSHQCLFCPANDGYLKRRVFEDFRTKGIIYVVDNIVDHIESYIEGNDNARIIHISPVADPFQPLERENHLSESIIKLANNLNYPIAICTKGIIPKYLYPRIKAHKDSFVQISILTINENKRQKIVRGDGASVKDLLNEIRELREYDIHVIGRIDPIFPYITDDLDEFEKLVCTLKNYGVKHIVSSVADIIPDALEREKEYLNSLSANMYQRYKSLYCDNINGRLHANIKYRERIFEALMRICEKNDMLFGITWEPDKNGNSINHIYSHKFRMGD